MVKKRIYLTKRQYKIAKYIYKKEPDEAQLREKFKLSEEEYAALLESLAEILTIGADNRLRLNEKGLVAYEEKHEHQTLSMDGIMDCSRDFDGSAGGEYRGYCHSLKSSV